MEAALAKIWLYVDAGMNSLSCKFIKGITEDRINYLLGLIGEPPIEQQG